MPRGIDHGRRRYAVATVVRGATEDFNGVGKRLSSRERLDDVRVAGARHLTGIPLAGDEDRILARPRHLLLAFGEIEPGLHERARLQVELADRARVFAAVGEGDEAALL